MTRNVEATLQAGIVQWLRKTVPDCLCFAVIQGGDLLTRSEASKRKWMGQLNGVADLVLVCSRKVVFLEVKSPSGQVASEQRAFGKNVQALGHYWAVIRSIDDARLALNALGIAVVEVQP